MIRRHMSQSADVDRIRESLDKAGFKLTRVVPTETPVSVVEAAQALWLAQRDLVVAPSFVIGLAFIYGLMAWNGVLSVSASRILPNYEFVGFEQYLRLWESERFRVALTNMAIFGSLFIGGAMGIGLLLAKTAIERAGGHLKLENRPDGSVVLPANVALDRSDRHVIVPASNRKTRHVHLSRRRHRSLCVFHDERRKASGISPGKEISD